MATSTLPKKLQMKAGQRAVILNPPSGFVNMLVPLPEGVELVAFSEEPCDFALVFVKNMADLQQFLPTVAQTVKYDALLWIAYPKGGAKAGTDLNRDLLWEAVAKHDLSSVTLVALDDVWSAMRFRPSDRVGR
jgi:hypothetical protein